MRAGLDPPAGFDKVGSGGRGDDGRSGHGQPWLERALVVDGGFDRPVGAGEEARPRPGRPGGGGAAIRRGGVEFDRLALDERRDPDRGDPDAGLGRLAALAEPAENSRIRSTTSRTLSSRVLPATTAIVTSWLP
jgi:hypothetical protein